METTIENNIYQVAEIKLTYSSRVKPSLRPKVNSSKDAYQILFDSWDKGHLELMEEFKILLLNRANKIIGIYEASSGGTTGTVADPKLIFAAALKSAACAIIISHNHPSGNLMASQADKDLTRKLRDGAKLLEIQLLDHIIVTAEGYYSFADEGLL